jgi:phospholipid/cholesterol/gamma-HCH transport system substrate-binding protein
MQRYTRLEVSVGAFMALGSAALLYLSFSLAGLKLESNEHYPIVARFASVGSLKEGDPVTVAGVNVGEVESIALVDFVAEARLLVDTKVQLPEDTIASIQSAGLLGDAYVSLSAGASDKDLQPGDRITHTEPAISITELIAKYAFGSPLSDDEDQKEGSEPARGTPNGEASGTDAAATAPAKSPFSDPLE